MPVIPPFLPCRAVNYDSNSSLLLSHIFSIVFVVNKEGNNENSQLPIILSLTCLPAECSKYQEENLTINPLFFCLNTTTYLVKQIRF